VPATLVLVTPEVTAAELPAFSKEFNMENALWASDPANSLNISTKNILQTSFISMGGKADYFENSREAKAVMSAPSVGVFRFVVEGLTDPKARELWWLVERQKPEAVKTLVSVTKQKSPLGADAVKILAVVKPTFEKTETELLAAPVSMATYESIEALLTESQGIELKKAAARYKELGKAKELKDELQARSIYRQCQEQLVSQKGGAPEAGKANLATLAQKFPNTKYGQLAAGK
jgi:hypothetical protein